MKLVKDPQGRRLEVRRGGGSLIFLGFLCVFLAGLLSALPLVTDAPGTTESGYPGVGLALGLCLLGGLLIFGRRGTTFRPEHGSMRRWWGLLGPLVASDLPLAGAREVRVRPEHPPTREGAARPQYSVALVRDEGALTLAFTAKEDEARAAGTEVAAFLELPLVDRTARETEQDRPEQVEEEREPLLTERLGPSEPEGRPSAPDRLESHLVTRGDALEIEIPPPGFNWAVGALLACLLLPVLLGLQALFMLPGDAGFAKQLMGVVFILALFVAAPLYLGGPWFLDRLRGRTRVRLSAGKGIEVERHGCRGIQTESLASNEIVDVGLNPAFAESDEPEGKSLSPAREEERAIVVRGTTGVLRFGGQLPTEERQYLVALMRHTLCAPAAEEPAG